MLTKLKVRILEKYRTQSRFAVCCGQGENWISRIIQERDVPSDESRNLICRKLQIKNPAKYFEANHGSHSEN